MTTTTASAATLTDATPTIQGTPNVEGIDETTTTKSAQLFAQAEEIAADVRERFDASIDHKLELLANFEDNPDDWQLWDEFKNCLPEFVEHVNRIEAEGMWLNTTGLENIYYPEEFSDEEIERVESWAGKTITRYAYEDDCGHSYYAVLSDNQMGEDLIEALAIYCNAIIAEREEVDA